MNIIEVYPEVEIHRGIATVVFKVRLKSGRIVLRRVRLPESELELV